MMNSFTYEFLLFVNYICLLSNTPFRFSISYSGSSSSSLSSDLFQGLIKKKKKSLRAILKNPDDFYPLLKPRMAVRHAEKQNPPEPHGGFCYTVLHKVSRSFVLVIQQLDTKLRNAVCIFCLVLRALDTVEDDTSIPIDVKMPILIAFHKHICERDWHFSFSFHFFKRKISYEAHIWNKFSYQEAIDYITKHVGAGMGKFTCKEVEKNYPNATKPLGRMEAIQKTCRESDLLSKRKSYIVKKELTYNFAMVVVLLIILAIIFAYLFANQSHN